MKSMFMAGFMVYGIAERIPVNGREHCTQEKMQ